VTGRSHVYTSQSLLLGVRGERSEVTDSMTALGRRDVFLFLIFHHSF
jgi:hypothetical protein